MTTPRDPVVEALHRQNREALQRRAQREAEKRRAEARRVSEAAAEDRRRARAEADRRAGDIRRQQVLASRADAIQRNRDLPQLAGRIAERKMEAARAARSAEASNAVRRAVFDARMKQRMEAQHAERSTEASNAVRRAVFDARMKQWMEAKRANRSTEASYDTALAKQQLEMMGTERRPTAYEDTQEYQDGPTRLWTPDQAYMHGDAQRYEQRPSSVIVPVAKAQLNPQWAAGQMDIPADAHEDPVIKRLFNQPASGYRPVALGSYSHAWVPDDLNEYSGDRQLLDETSFNFPIWRPRHPWEDERPPEGDFTLSLSPISFIPWIGQTTHLRADFEDRHLSRGELAWAGGGTIFDLLMLGGLVDVARAGKGVKNPGLVAAASEKPLTQEQLEAIIRAGKVTGEEGISTRWQSIYGRGGDFDPRFQMGYGEGPDARNLLAENLWMSGPSDSAAQWRRYIQLQRAINESKRYGEGTDLQRLLGEGGPDWGRGGGGGGGINPTTGPTGPRADIPDTRAADDLAQREILEAQSTVKGGTGQQSGFSPIHASLADSMAVRPLPPGVAYITMPQGRVVAFPEPTGGEAPPPSQTGGTRIVTPPDLALAATPALPAFTPTPGTRIAPPPDLPTPVIRIVTPPDLPTPETRIVTPSDLPTPETRIVTPSDLPTPETRIVTPSDLPTPETRIVTPSDLPTPETRIVTPSDLPTPETRIVTPSDLPTPETRIVTPSDLPTPETRIVTQPDLPTPETRIVTPSDLPTPVIRIVTPSDLPTPETRIVTQPVDVAARADFTGVAARADFTGVAARADFTPEPQKPPKSRMRIRLPRPKPPSSDFNLSPKAPRTSGKHPHVVEWISHSRNRLDLRTGEHASAPASDTNVDTFRVTDRGTQSTSGKEYRAANLEVESSRGRAFATPVPRRKRRRSRGRRRDDNIDQAPPGTLTFVPRDPNSRR